MPHIILADDHIMIRKGIKLFLTSRLNLKDIYEVDSCNALMVELKKGHCTHIILDVVFADGTSLEIVPTIRKLYPHIKIMIYSMQSQEIYSESFRQYNIHYYLSKSASEEYAMKYIRKFIENEPAPASVTSHSGVNNPFGMLAPRELEILHYLLNGYKTINIAKALNLTDSTVSTLKKRIFEKTNAASLAELFELASIFNISFFIGTPNVPAV